jgi:IclR family pca regulon transcriptional regulator
MNSPRSAEQKKAKPVPHENPLFLGTVRKCFQLLETINQARRPLALKELAASSGMERSAVQRLAFTLHALGYVRQDPLTRAFSLSGKLLEFGHTVLAMNTVLDRARPHMQALNQMTGETVNLMELEATEIVYVARFPSLHAVSVDLHVGSRLPAFCTAAGRAILARVEPEEALTVLKQSVRTAMTSKTVTDLKGLAAALADARRLGFALNDQEAFIGDISVAAVLVNRLGKPVGAVNVAVPFPRWEVSSVLKKLVPQLMVTARAINKEIQSF